jgi:hypothetical protein
MLGPLEVTALARSFLAWLAGSIAVLIFLGAKRRLTNARNRREAHKRTGTVQRIQIASKFLVGQFDSLISSDDGLYCVRH